MGVGFAHLMHTPVHTSGVQLLALRRTRPFDDTPAVISEAMLTLAEWSFARNR